MKREKHEFLDQKTGWVFISSGDERMTMTKKLHLLRLKEGISIVELMLALCIGSIVMAGVYRVWIGSQKAYHVQDQVVDMQQNARVAIQKMIREIRMAGFGSVSNVLPLSAVNGPFLNIINPVNGTNRVNQNDDEVTVVGAFDQVAALLRTRLSERTPLNSQGMELLSIRLETENTYASEEWSPVWLRM